ncbi:MAG: hypothetical protein MHMPM18_003572 [Marteilia pararefringens]
MTDAKQLKSEQQQQQMPVAVKALHKFRLKSVIIPISFPILIHSSIPLISEFYLNGLQIQLVQIVLFQACSYPVAF